MVMDPDPTLRDNRLALLHWFITPYMQIADFRLARRCRVTFVKAFGGGAAEGRAKDKALLGGKGANLAEMASLGLPVPPGFTITTEVCRHVMQHGAGTIRTGSTPRSRRRSRKVEQLAEREVRRRDAARCSCRVRSGAPASMPGMMDTILNLGLNDRDGRGARHAERATRGSRGTAIAGSSRCTARSCSASSRHEA